MTEQERKLTVDREMELLHFYFQNQHHNEKYSIFPTTGVNPEQRYYTLVNANEEEANFWGNIEIAVLNDVPCCLRNAEGESSLLPYLFEANTTDVEELIAYWIKAEDVHLRQYYRYEVEEIEAQGHTIVEIVPCYDELYFATFRCKKQGLEYWIHTDDGEVGVTQSPEYYFGHPQNANHNAMPLHKTDDYVQHVDDVVRFYATP